MGGGSPEGVGQMWSRLHNILPDPLGTCHVLPPRLICADIFVCIHVLYVGVCTHPPKLCLHFPNHSPLQCCRFFEALEQRHKAQVCVEDISDILEDHAERHFHPYIAYCSNEVYQQRTLQKLS